MDTPDDDPEIVAELKRYSRDVTDTPPATIIQQAPVVVRPIALRAKLIPRPPSYGLIQKTSTVAAVLRHNGNCNNVAFLINRDGRAFHFSRAEL